MPRAKAFTRLELIRKLRQHDRQFEVDPKRAKGSEVMLFHPNVDGRRGPIRFRATTMVLLYDEGI